MIVDDIETLAGLGDAVEAASRIIEQKAAPTIYGSGGEGDQGPPAAAAAYGSGNAGDQGPPAALAPAQPSAPAPAAAPPASNRKPAQMTTGEKVAIGAGVGLLILVLATAYKPRRRGRR